MFCYTFDASMCNRSNYFIHNMWRNNSFRSYLMKYSRFYSTFSKAMNKIISTEERIFISLVGPSGSGKSLLEVSLFRLLRQTMDVYRRLV